jgi:hypothetical protein
MEFKQILAGLTICIILSPIMAIGKEQKQSAEMGILRSDVWRNKTPDWTAEGKQEEAYFGVVVSTAGDVNGDGYGDVIIGAPGYDNDQDDDGRVFVYYGSASGLSKTAAWTAKGNQDEAYFGWSVSTAGDVNGDGYSDVIIGAPGYHEYAGRAFVYYGSASGLSTGAKWIGGAEQAKEYYGVSVSEAGDVNGDGYSDVIVGADMYDNGERNEGRAYVYHGSASGLSQSYDWTAEGNQDEAYFGTSVSEAGDVNGDGFSDVIIGADMYDDSVNADVGYVYVYHGSASGLSKTAAWTATGKQEFAYFGISVSEAGDVNGDGFSDVIIGAHYYGEANEGRAFVYHGSASGLSKTAAWTAEGDQAYAHFGISVSEAGDVNGDGFSDVIVGVYGYNGDQPNEGKAFVYHGSASGLLKTSSWAAGVGQKYAYFGISVSEAGDVNGDGFSDVIIGAYQYDNSDKNEGSTFIYYGNTLR